MNKKFNEWHKKTSVKLLKVLGKLLRWTDEEMEETCKILESSFDNSVL